MGQIFADHLKANEAAVEEDGGANLYVGGKSGVIDDDAGDAFGR